LELADECFLDLFLFGDLCAGDAQRGHEGGFVGDVYVLSHQAATSGVGVPYPAVCRSGTRVDRWTRTGALYRSWSRGRWAFRSAYQLTRSRCAHHEAARLGPYPGRLVTRMPMSAWALRRSVSVSSSQSEMSPSDAVSAARPDLISQHRPGVPVMSPW